MLDTTEFVLSEPLKFMGVERVSVRSAVTSIKITRIHQNTLKISFNNGHTIYNKCSDNNWHYTLISMALHQQSNKFMVPIRPKDSCYSPISLIFRIHVTNIEAFATRMQNLVRGHKINTCTTSV
jgi:hypothetical protein